MVFFFFNDTATTEIYTLSLHDALPIWDAVRCATRLRGGADQCRGRAAALRRERPVRGQFPQRHRARCRPDQRGGRDQVARDRKSTRLNSSHANISYAVFCLKKKK